jgi:hypothetical protein
MNIISQSAEHFREAGFASGNYSITEQPLHTVLLTDAYNLISPLSISLESND